MEGIVGYAGSQNITFVARPSNGGSDITQFISVPPSGVFSLTGLTFAP